MVKHRYPVLAGILVLLLVACASNPPAVDLSAYRSVVIKVNPAEGHDPQDLERLQAILTETMQGNGPFPGVGTDNGEPTSTLTIAVDVETIRRVSNARRVSMGRTAGSNTVSAWFTLMDPGGAELSRFKLIAYSPQKTGISPDWPWGDLETAMERLGRQLAGQLTNWYNRR